MVINLGLIRGILRGRELIMRFGCLHPPFSHVEKNKF